MNCQSCGESNRDGAKFCWFCGQALPRRCGACGTDLRPRARFCDQCGTPVVEGPTPDDAAPARTDSVDDDAAPATIDSVEDVAVRKTVTVLFADLVGSTAFGEQVDAESARSEMAAYFELAQAVIDENQGTLVKFTGDGVMAVFGIPEMAEDDAVRAVNAGSDMQAGFEQIATRVSDHYGFDIGLRVGINTGEVVIAEQDADIVGDAINTAARIEAACPAGEVLVGEPTWRLTRSAVEYEPLGEVSVKGKEDPVATYQVLSRAHEDELRTPFVGRKEELARLSDALDAAVRDGATRLVTVIGDPGVGKTRLASELRAELAGRARTFDLRVDQSGVSTFGPVADLIRTATGLEEGASPEIVESRIHDLLGAEPTDTPRLAPLLAGLVGAAPTRSAEESFWATRRLVEVLARSQPVVLVVDDIQWAEPLFLDLVDHLVDWVGAPALLVGLARPELRDIRPSLAEIGRRVSDVVTLEGLDALATEALAAQILGTDRLPPGLSQRLPESTDGNPLFVRELVRMLVDDGVITRTDGEWELAIDSEAVDVPPTIQSLLASRVERMPPDERRVVEMASVVGSEFALGAVRHLMPALDPGELDGTLERLRRKNIVEPTGTYWGNEPLLRFHHVLFRDAAYRRLLKQRRAELHLQTARWTEGAATRLSGEHEIAIAHHFEQAHEYLSALGSVAEETDAIGRRAAELLHGAARQAVDRDDLAAAGALSQRALARLGPDAPERAEVLLIACEAFLSLGDMRAARPHLDELAALAVEDDRLGAWTDAFEGQWVVLTQPERLASSEAKVAAAAERLEDLDDQAGVAKARLVRALILARLGRVGDCEAELDRALSAARAAGDRRRITAVLGAAPLAALWGPSPVARAGGRCLDIIRLLRITSASPIVEATSIRCQGVLEAMRGRFDQARDLIDRARELVEDLGTSHGLLDTDMNAGIVELLAGNPEEAESLLREAYTGLRLLGVGTDAGQAAALLARALVAQGRLDEAEEMAIDSDALAGQNLQTAIGSRATRAEIAAARGDHGEALALAEEAVALAAPTDLTFNRARAVGCLASVQELAGDAAGAAASAEEASRLYEAKGAIPLASPARGTPAVTTLTKPARIDIENRASGSASAFWESLFGQRDMDAALVFVAEDAEVVDRRQMLQNRMTRSDIRDWFGPIVASATPIEWTARVLAVRGDDLCLQSASAVNQGSMFGSPIIGVAQVDSSGLISRYTVHDPENLQAAIEELDRRWVESDSQVPAESADIVRSFLAAASTPDANVEGWLTDDFHVIDHRELGLPELDLVGYLEALVVTTEQVGGFTAIASKVHTCSADRILITTSRLGSAAHGGEITWSALDLLTFSDGRISGLEIFAEDKLDTALARFEELESGAPPALLSNPASELGRALRERLYDERDLDATLDLLADDFVSENRRRLGYSTMTTTDLGSWFREVLEFDGHIEWEHETIAVRGDDLALARWVSKRPGSEFGNEILWLLERDREGRLASAVIFDPDQLYDAFDQLDAWYAMTFDDGSTLPIQVANKAARYYTNGEFDEMMQLMTDDFVSVDHRSSSFGELDGEGWLDRGRSLHEVAPGFRTVHRAVVRMTDHGVVTRTRTTTGSGSAVEWDLAGIFLSDGDSLARIELFEYEDIDRALARFEELTGDQPHTDHPGTIAERATEELIGIFNDQDYESMSAMLVPGFTIETRRPLGIPLLDAGEFVETIREIHDVTEDVRFSIETLASRGDHLALGALTWGGETGFFTEIVMVNEVAPDGRLRRSVTFDLDQIDDAIEQLDRWYAETLDEGAASALVVADRAAAHVTNGHFDAFEALLTDDFVSVDHRPGSFGELDRDGTIERMRSLHDVLAPGFLILNTEIHRATDEGVVTRARTADPGSVGEWDYANLYLVSGGRLARLEHFEFEDLDAALSRFDELTAGETKEPVRVIPETLVERLSSATADAVNRRDFDAVTSMMDPALTVEARRPLGPPPLNLEEWVATMKEIFELSEQASLSREMLATRGERYGLYRVRWTGLDDFFTEILMAVECDDDGHGTRLVTFDSDQTDDAIELLDDWYAESFTDDTGLAAAASQQFIRSWTSGDVDGIEALLTDDFVCIDHRLGMFDDLDKPGMLERMRSIHEVVPGFKAHMVSTVRVCPFGGVGTGRVTSTDGFEWDLAMIMLSTGGRITRIEYFELEDLDGALARFDELIADADG